MQEWALILGGSGGMGLAAAKKLAEKGFSLFIVHRDRRARLKVVLPEFETLRQQGHEVVTLNENALLEDGIRTILQEMEARIPKKSIKIYLHAIAMGNVKPLYSPDDAPVLSSDDLLQTIHAMGVSFFEWARLLIDHDFFAPKARILGLTSEGSRLVGKGYAAVGSAKAVLENLCRYMAVELAPLGITTNLLNAGVTDTPALRMIPGAEKYLRKAKERNPSGRLTTPEDVANVISLFTQNESDWINGAIIRVDGGEQIAGWSEAPEK